MWLLIRPSNFFRVSPRQDRKITSASQTADPTCASTHLDEILNFTILCYFLDSFVSWTRRHWRFNRRLGPSIEKSGMKMSHFLFKKRLFFICILLLVLFNSRATYLCQVSHNTAAASLLWFIKYVIQFINRRSLGKTREKSECSWTGVDFTTSVSLSDAKPL